MLSHVESCNRLLVFLVLQIALKSGANFGQVLVLELVVVLLQQHRPEVDQALTYDQIIQFTLVILTSCYVPKTTPTEAVRHQIYPKLATKERSSQTQ